MKNAYAAKLKAKQQQRDHEATQGGFNLALMLVAVALNNLYGFGAKRLEETETEVQRLWDEEFMQDTEMAAHSLAARIEQIRGAKK